MASTRVPRPHWVICVICGSRTRENMSYNQVESRTKSIPSSLRISAKE